MAREGRQRPYYDEERYTRNYDYPEREQRWRDREEPERGTRERLERYFSRHGEEEERPHREEERSYQEQGQQGQQMLGRGYRQDQQREDFERGYRQQRGRESFGGEERYGAEGERRTGYLPERAREEYARRFRPDYDWEREDFERAMREQRGREGYGGEERYEPEHSRVYQPETEEWRMRGPYAGRGPRGYKRSDENIYEEVCERLMQHGRIDASNIEVEVRDAIVTLRGSVNNRQSKYLAEDISGSIFGVKDVQNELKIDQSVGMTERYQPGWRSDMIQRLSRGMEVLDKNGESIGQVKEVRDHDFRLDRRMQRDIFVPFDAIDSVDNKVVLSVAEHRMDDMGWQKPEWAGMQR